MVGVHHALVVLSDEQIAELRAVVNSRDVPAVVATRARIVLWTAEGRMRKDVGALAGVSLPTVDRWVERYARLGLAGLEERRRGAGRVEVPAAVRARVLALTRTPPPVHTGPSHCRWTGCPGDREGGGHDPAHRLQVGQPVPWWWSGRLGGPRVDRTAPVGSGR